MSVLFNTGASQGEVCRLPDRVTAFTSGVGLAGVSFVDMGFREPGWGFYSITGLKIIGWMMPRGSTYRSERGEQVWEGHGRGLTLLGPSSEDNKTWTGAYSARVLSVSPVAAERIYQRPIGQIIVDPSTNAGAERRSVNHMLSALSALFREGPSPDPLLVDSLCLAVLRSVVEPVADGQRHMSHLTTFQADQIRGYIDANLSDAIKVATMAELLGLSESYFIKAFRKTFGLTPYKFVMRERVTAAQKIINTSDTPLTEVASKTGFSSASNMTRTFRQILGATPTGRKLRDV